MFKMKHQLAVRDEGWRCTLCGWPADHFRLMAIIVDPALPEPARDLIQNKVLACRRCAISVSFQLLHEWPHARETRAGHRLHPGVWTAAPLQRFNALIDVPDHVPEETEWCGWCRRAVDKNRHPISHFGGRSLPTYTRS